MESAKARAYCNQSEGEEPCSPSRLARPSPPLRMRWSWLTAKVGPATGASRFIHGLMVRGVVDRLPDPIALCLQQPGGEEAYSGIAAAASSARRRISSGR